MRQYGKIDSEKLERQLEEFQKFTSELKPYINPEQFSEREKQVLSQLPIFPKTKLNDKRRVIEIPNTLSSYFFNGNFESGNLQKVV